MREDRLLAILGLLLALIAGLLLVLDGANIPRNATIEELILRVALPLILGVGTIVGGVGLVQGRYTTGGVVCLLLGILAFALGQGTLEAILAAAAGILGLVAGSLRNQRLEESYHRR